MPTYGNIETKKKGYDGKSQCSCIKFLGICVALMLFVFILSISVTLEVEDLLDIEREEGGFGSTGR
ncbi:MAG: hypothetical protein JW779_14140 [Candidatus Thorarchaeota archaeon]|nr:hypothetical protein [Candidatus Thorarchaeota archaeon]